jgi:hypothetical protein
LLPLGNISIIRGKSKARSNPVRRRLRKPSAGEPTSKPLIVVLVLPMRNIQSPAGRVRANPVPEAPDREPDRPKL